MIRLRPTGWEVVGIAAGLWTLARQAFAAPPGAAGGRLLVFLQLDMKQGVLQKLLRDAIGAEVTAVGRVADFERELEKSPDAVLTLPPVLEEHGLAVKLQGRRAESDVEPCVLVGNGAPPRPDSVRRLGALDFLGHKGMKDFILHLLGASPSVKRVTKFEDLLPLLQLDMADAILVPKRLVSALTARTELKLETTDVGNLSLPAAVALGPKGNVVLEAVKVLPKALAVEMGVEAWR